ncbi:MAG: pilus assembly protein TadG-related protein [Pseudomonadota bacterium]
MHLLNEFLENRRGNIAILAAILILPLMMLTGVGIDYTRISSAEGNLQTSLDNAAVDGRRLFRLGPRAEGEIAALINANSGRNTAQVRIRINQNKLRVDVRDEISTPMLSTIGQPKSEVTASIELDGNQFSGSQSQRETGAKETSKPANNREIARLQSYEAQLRKSLDHLRKAGSRLPLQTRQRLQQELRQQLREVRTRIRQLKSA